VVAPLIDARWDPDFDILNGRLRAFANGVVLDRTAASQVPFPSNTLIPEAVTPISDPCIGRSTCPGVSDQTASGGVQWRSAYTLDGVRLEPFLDLRGSVYEVESGFRPFPGLNTLTAFPNATIERGMANLGLDLSYPLYRPIGSADLIVEPMAELILAPKATYDPRVPNEDSQALAVDETTLFRPDALPGYDVYQGGPRASVGAMTTLDWGEAHDAHFFFGRQFNSQNPIPFPASFGLDNLYSDWMTYASVSPINGLNAWTRELYNSNTWELERTEAAASWNVSWTHGIVRYLNDNTGLLDLIDPNYTFPLTPPGRVEEAEAAGYVMATRHWGLTFDAIRNLRENFWNRSEVGILYRDICVDVAVVYERTETSPLGPSSGVTMRLNFPMSGSLGFLNYDTR
jgi:LPS-assembly protein